MESGKITTLSHKSNTQVIHSPNIMESGKITTLSHISNMQVIHSPKIMESGKIDHNAITHI